MTPVLYVGQQVADELLSNLEDNLGRYREGDFSDLVQSGNWGLELSVRADIARLEGLSAEAGAASEIANSMLTGKVLSELTPTLAREERLWVRLSHVECLEYSRKRWLKEGVSDESLLKDVEKHFFCPRDYRLPGRPCDFPSVVESPYCAKNHAERSGTCVKQHTGPGRHPQ